jgi:hypothetical protein
MSRSTLAALLGCLTLALGLGACGGDDKKSSSAPAATETTAAADTATTDAGAAGEAQIAEDVPADKAELIQSLVTAINDDPALICSEQASTPEFIDAQGGAEECAANQSDDPASITSIETSDGGYTVNLTNDKTGDKGVLTIVEDGSEIFISDFQAG